MDSKIFKLIFGLILFILITKINARSSDHVEIFQDDVNCQLPYTCASVGDKCNDQLDYNDAIGCKNGSKCCAFGLVCIGGTCSESIDGKDCTTSKDCQTSFFVGNCVKGVCKEVSLQNGECTVNTDCADGLTCNRKKFLCTGVADGQECRKMNDTSLMVDNCNIGLYCNDANHCERYRIEDEPCNTTFVCDSTMFFCNDQGICQDLMSVKENDTCTDYTQCKAGLTCAHGICVKADWGNYMKSCNISADCGPNYTCGCAGTEQVCIPNFGFNPESTAKEEEAYNRCLYRNKCPSLPANNLPKESCAYRRCLAESEKLLLKQCEFFPAVFNANPLKTCLWTFDICVTHNGLTKGEWVMLGVVGVISALAFAGMITFFVKRRTWRQYRRL